MDKQKAREFLRRLNDLQQEFGMRLNPGNDGDPDGVEDVATGETAYVSRDRWEWLLSADYDERHPVQFYTCPVIAQMSPEMGIRRKG